MLTFIFIGLAVVVLPLIAFLVYSASAKRGSNVKVDGQAPSAGSQGQDRASGLD